MKDKECSLGLKLGLFILFMISLFVYSCSVEAGFYIDIGGGWVEEVTAEQTTEVDSPLGTVTVNNQVSVPLDSGFLLFRGGYRYKKTHIELETIGDARRSFKTLKFYYRWEFE